MATWQLQEAKARFSEVVDTAQRKGPQIVTKRGVETAVVMSMEDWIAARRPSAPVSSSASRELTAEERAESEAFLRLLRSGPDFEIPDRHQERLNARKARRQRVRS